MDDWLTDIREECEAALFAALYRPGLAPPRVYDLAEEAVDEAITRALSRTKQFESRTHCRNWVVMVARNKAIEWLRTDVGHRAKLERLHADGRVRYAEQTPAPSPLQPFIELMKDGLARLPDEERRLIERHYLDGLTLMELVEEFGLRNLSAAWKRVHDTLRRLRTIMEQLGAVPEGWESALAEPPP